MTTTTDEPAIVLPTASLLGTLVGASVLTGGAWWAVATAIGRADAALPGLVAAAVVALCTTAGLLVMTPWRPRPVSLWISIWLAQTVVRLLVTPVVTYLLYSATPFPAMPLFVAVGAVYLVAVTSEASVLARHLRHTASV